MTYAVLDSGKQIIDQLFLDILKIQPKTIDLSTRLRGINPTNSLIIYFPEPLAEVNCLRLNFNIVKISVTSPIVIYMPTREVWLVKQRVLFAF